MASTFSKAKSLTSSNRISLAGSFLESGKITNREENLLMTWFDVIKYPLSVIKKPVPIEILSLGLTCGEEDSRGGGDKARGGGNSAHKNSI